MRLTTKFCGKNLDGVLALYNLNRCVASEIALLVPDFRKQLIRSLDAAKSQGIFIEVITTLITPMEQAALWKQGRTRIDAELKMLALRHAQAPYLAECLQKAVPQETNIVTDFLPGYSWHQWGEAAQVVWIDGSRINWFAGVGSGYRKFAKILNEFSIHCGGEIEDSPVAWRTVTLRGSPNAGESYRLPQIDEEMQKRFKR